MLAVVVLLADIVSKGHGAFRQTYVQLAVHYDPELLDIDDAIGAQHLGHSSSIDLLVEVDGGEGVPGGSPGRRQIASGAPVAGGATAGRRQVAGGSSHAF